MTAVFLLAILAQIPLFFWGIRRLVREGVGFFSFFHLLFASAVIVPFVIIAVEQGGWIDLYQWFRFPKPRVGLPFGDGLRPLTWILVVHACFVAGGLIALWLAKRRNPEVEPMPALQQVGWERLRVVAGLMIACAGSYIAVRNVVQPDFPLFAVLAGEKGKVRDIAFEYGANRHVPWLFLPSIHSQFYRILLPLASLVMFAVWLHGGRKRSALVVSVLGAGAALLMSLGTMKRTPLVYLTLWVFCWWSMYRPWSRRTLKILAIGAGSLLLVLAVITSTYRGQRHNLQSRIIYGEAVADYLAIEHHPETYAYRGVGVFSPYVAKMFGGDARSFSEVWKKEITVGEGRGFDAVGIFTEWYIAFGWLACAVASAVVGFILASFDAHLTRRGVAEDERPFLAGVMMVVGAMTVKGMLSQFFTGGAFTVLLCYAAWRMLRPKDVAVAATTSDQLSSSPIPTT